MAKPVINYKGYMTVNPGDRSGDKICIPQIVAALCGGLLLKYICAHVQAGMLVVAGVLLILGACSVFLIREKE